MKISLLADCPNEAKDIAEWYFQEWAHKDPQATLESVTEKVLLGANRTELPVTFVMHINNELSGAGELKYRELPEYPGYYYWLDGIYVPSIHRGKGISTELIEFAKSKVIELNLSGLYLRCDSHKVKLYEARDFQTVRIEEGKFIMEYLVNTYAPQGYQ